MREGLPAARTERPETAALRARGLGSRSTHLVPGEDLEDVDRDEELYAVCVECLTGLDLEIVDRFDLLAAADHAADQLVTRADLNAYITVRLV